MYAVGRVISTVSGPFHPFGGAVDIVVVQQQDGSFKSSPWYVRFGKFQGVLKTREKVVSIAVNGVEAGFHMYLDSNGEAYFLRDVDPNAEEGEFVVSPASSGDEREVPIQEAQLRKSKSTSFDSSTMEANVGDVKMLARTTSRRTTILERMFGRKSVKNNAHVVDRVSSLERAEIAAELLDTKWSTNLSRGSKIHSSIDEPSKSNVIDAGNSDQVETSKTVLPEHSFDNGKELGSNCDSADCNFCSPRGERNSSADDTDHCLQTTSVKEEVVEIYTHESSDFTDRIPSTKDQPESESLSNDLGTDKCIHESVDTQGELLHNCEDVVGMEMHTDGVLSNGIFEIHTVKTDITSGKSEVVSQFVTVDSDGTNQNFTDANSPTYGTTDVSTERHEVSLKPSPQDAVQEKVVIVSSSETVEYAVSSILVGKVHDAADVSLAVGVQHEEPTRVSDGRIEQLISEERSLACYSAPSSEEDTINVVGQDQEAFVLEDSTSQILQANGPDMNISIGTVAGTDSAHDLACQHDVVCTDASSSDEILSYMPENDLEGVTKDSTDENKAYNGELDVSVTQTLTMEDGPRECIPQSAIFSKKVEVESLPIVTGFSSLGKMEAQNTKIEDDANRSGSVSGVEIGSVPEAIAEPREEAEAVVPISEFTEEIQFQFSDTESFADRKAMDDTISIKTEGEGEHDESDCDAEEQEGGDIDLANDLENCSDPLRPETRPVPIPGSELHSGDKNTVVKSLPNLRSHIHDLERSDNFQLSRSLQSDAENNGVDSVKSTDSAFPENEPEATGDSDENSNPPELTSNALPDNKHADDLKVDSFNPFAELSLCRHLLTEGMGEDAARRAFDSEKVTVEKFRTMKQSLIRNNKLVVRIAGRYFPWDAAAPIVLGMISFSEEQVFEPQGMIKVEQVEPNAVQGGSWRIWPFSFRRTKTISAVQPVCESTVEDALSTLVKEADRERNKSRAKRMERKVRSLAPTSEELASLDLREGKNVVTFTFSTAMLGRQQVDCRIYLWKWNTRIVISDVDGTITKSDVLGQFMPLVGVDWSQNGVAHLFSAIKENGYQLLFLSARAISQAHLTRQFLFNLKQDGKALPDGPVVISPDGLFPSLYREVIRRAPHEFKISCLERYR
ncbi:phosphatidate phosphatase PAH2-like isoform X2 [Phragmites australis]|uniref:phosphatidate phosphatase PAH2-like isoform X2 n=1 Tax=Phragmites australis TaxID=29695 RepID=UPI002D78437F|nr:phosphatidate phosphatase PAH2-like isoform X2 [Phragmites australis]